MRSGRLPVAALPATVIIVRAIIVSSCLRFWIASVFLKYLAISLTHVNAEAGEVRQASLLVLLSLQDLYRHAPLQQPHLLVESLLHAFGRRHLRNLHLHLDMYLKRNADRATMLYGFMSLFLIRQINNNFTTSKGLDAGITTMNLVFAMPIAAFMAVGWVGQRISVYLPHDLIMYAITLCGIGYYCFFKMSYKSPRRLIEVVCLLACYLFLIGKAALPLNLRSGLSALVGLVCVLFMTFCLWYRNHTLETRLLQ